MNLTEDKKYPIGQFVQPENINDTELDLYIQTLKYFPSRLKALVVNWSDEQLDTQYRESGWTVRQLISHLADSHMQSFIAFKQALTEENPTISPFDEHRCAELQDSRNEPVKAPLMILEGVHCRWVHLLKTMTNKDFDRTYYHARRDETCTLRNDTVYYSWHCDHHFAHLEKLKNEKNWA